MARCLRIESAGAFYHVMARGNLRQTIFHDEEDHLFFLRTLADGCERTGWRVHAWVLMSNHYHLFLETPEPNLVAGMSWLQNAFTRRYNVRHRAWGRVFGDRYKSVIVDGEDRYHYHTLMDYIHLNPVRARLVQPNEGQSVLDYRWSSVAGGYALPPKRRPKWLAATAGLKAFELADTAARRRKMVERLDRRAVEEEASQCGVPMLPEEVDARVSHLRRGWYWGSQAFGEKMAKLAQRLIRGKGKPKSRGYRTEVHVRRHSEREAQRWLEEGLTAAGLRRAELERLPGSDPRKVLIAERLWRETVVSQGWLAEKLRMKSAANVSQQVRRLDREKALAKVSDELRQWLKEGGGR